MTLDRKTIKEGDQVWVAHAGCHAGDPYASVYGGVVVAAGSDGTFCYRTAEGRVDTCQWWSLVTATATEAEAWQAAADQLQKIAHALLAKVDECRTKAHQEVTA